MAEVADWNLGWEQSKLRWEESCRKMKEVAEKLMMSLGQTVEELKKLREEREALDSENAEELEELSNQPNFSKEDTETVSECLKIANSGQEFTTEPPFSDSIQEVTTEHSFSASIAAQEILARVHNVRQEDQEEVIPDFSKLVDFEVQEQEMFKISVVPIETNIAYNAFDKMSNMEIGFNSVGVGTNLTLRLNSNLKECLGRQNQDFRILGKHPDELIHEFGYQGFQWDPGVGFTDSLSSRDHFLKQMMTFSDNVEVFKALPFELRCGFGDSFELSESFIFDPGGCFSEEVSVGSAYAKLDVESKWMSLNGKSQEDCRFNFTKEMASLSTSRRYDISYHVGKFSCKLIVEDKRYCAAQMLHFGNKSELIFVFDPGGGLGAEKLGVNSPSPVVLPHCCWRLGELILVFDPGIAHKLDLQAVLIDGCWVLRGLIFVFDPGGSGYLLQVLLVAVRIIGTDVCFLSALDTKDFELGTLESGQVLLFQKWNCGSKLKHKF